MDEQQKELQRAIKAQEQAEREQQNDQGLISAMNKQTSLTHVLKRGNFESLANTATGLDSLIGASTAQEIAGGDDIEQLKRYSEKIAMEADESANMAAQEQHNIVVSKASEGTIGDDEVIKARIMAQQMQEQLARGVEEAETLKKFKDAQLQQHKKQGKGFSSMISQIHQFSSLLNSQKKKHTVVA